MDLVSAGFDSIPGSASRLYRGSEEHRFYEIAFRDFFLQSGFSGEGGATLLGPFGEITFPYVEMGAVSSLDLFGLDELILFSIYSTNRAKYRRFADLGANLGLHSIVAAKVGWEVTAYEPDPLIFGLLQGNLAANSVSARTEQKAVGREFDNRTFTRVLGNLTGSHLSGSKANPYGELEQFSVAVEAFSLVMGEHDFLKIDVEGAEAELICSTEAVDWQGTDAVMEIGSAENALAVFEHFKKMGTVNLFSQKRGWTLAKKLEDLPVSHREGSVFISVSGEGPFALA